MKRSAHKKKNSHFLLIAIVPLITFFLWVAQAGANDEETPASSRLSQTEILRLGEQMYREGILPSGEPMKAVVKGDIPVSGTAFTCVSCHLRSGIGSEEGNVVTPPTNGRNLYRPVAMFHKYYEVPSAPPVRPAYTDKSLADALRTGVDPAGRKLKDIMPRYMLDDKDMAILISYLKSLSSDFSPGVTDTTIRFATVVTDDVSPEDRDAMLTSLEKYFTYKNNQAKFYKSKVGRRSARMAESMLLSREVAYKRLLLSRWILKGPPETWRSQLQEYYRREPVFALLSGITRGQWQPVHRFCEDHRIPCILPITDFPAISDTDWYTLYFSKGLYQEGEAAARYLNSTAGESKDQTVVEVLRDSPKGRALSKGFQQTWRALGNRPIASVTLRDGEALTRKSLQRILTREKPAALLVWDGPSALPALEAIADSANRPDRVFFSSGYLGEAIWTLDEKARDFIYLTYPFRLPRDEAQYTKVVESFMGIHNFTGEKLIILKRVYSAVQVLSQGLMGLNGNYYRDYLLDLFGMPTGTGGMGLQAGTALWEPEEIFPLYERFSFGQGQRYASKGCYIVQLAKGPKHELVKKSDWAIH
jgi:hypothetical protein